MADIVNLTSTALQHDRERLESFGGHTIARGRATRWHWAQDSEGNSVFDIFRGGEHEVLAARIARNLKSFHARDADGELIVSGSLDHVFAELDDYFARQHGESQQPD